MIAALYVEPNGIYYGVRGVIPWGPDRDARRYRGPHPVIAHPPCQRWGNLGRLNYARYGGEHNRPGNDGGCFRAALDVVRAYGGVLEHPAFSHAWPAHGLAAPEGIGWDPCGTYEWVCEVWQSAYGHRARKRTWLLYVGNRRPLELNWARDPGTHHVGAHPRGGKDALSKRETPLAFRDALIRLARHSRKP